MKTFSKNLVQLTGHLGNDVQMMEFDNGNKKASFSLAVNNTYSSGSGESKKETSWFNIVAWGKTADDICATLKKGMGVSIEGKISARKYVDKSGNNKYVTEIVISQFEKAEKEMMTSSSAE
ncbi:MAG: single-stranded DNA-binding protein [Saprospiraceae bacterium]|nr:single-stranded DNA-binding protein [Saprospiraceae bacterium]MBK6564271.1 single-stranded DNA-binding protein [Saprospiraceae bacterium]MBK6782436.1 single-stranded DNA-binding protein [Saprospiraceae bacterium]MBK7524047.1 single-stranded DNA-binding protein [Saprospiraceae bacterium]MBK8078982.1 single-stranded DNA-binding protein [Saprospiraceae bacterium]